ncbi:MAG: hypothetical protein FD126_439 [Elusimicrobia bacterium]|nr:MAG: hypothetical protein FD126_439 [Elusimicrobiota bacterium]
MMRKVLSGLALGALVFAVACKPPKYIKYMSESGDFSTEVPWGWSVYLDRQGDDYYNYTFVGPFEPEFHRGVPTLQVRWYGKDRVHSLPDGQLEAYAGPEDFVAKTLRDVYGAERALVQEPHRISVAGWEATHFVVVSAMEVPSTMTFGVSSDRGGKQTVVLRQHAYAVVPMDTGFYVLIYPATRAGFPKYEERFNNMVNKFRTLKDGPSGPLLKP